MNFTVNSFFNLKQRGMKNVIVIATCLIVTFYACKKNDASLTVQHNEFIGVWEMDTMGYDMNNNGLWDNNDTARQVPDSMKEVLTLNSDGTGTRAYHGQSDMINWEVSADGKSLHLKYGTVFTLTYTIENITSLRLLVSTVLNSGGTNFRAFYAFTKK